MKTIVYVDGYNLFYGCLKHSADKWLDLNALFFDKILHAQCPGCEPVSLKFFTADIKAKIASQGQGAQIAQQSYHRALQAKNPDQFRIIKGYYSLDKARLLAYQQPPDKTKRIDVCSGLLIPDTILGGNMASNEVFNDKRKKKFYPGVQA